MEVNGPAPAYGPGVQGGTTRWLPWRVAMERALYGPGGFYRRESPAAHFRTSVHTSALYAAAVARLVAELDDALGVGEPLQVVDIGAGRGELLVALADLVPAEVQLTGVDIVSRPADLPKRVGWRRWVPPAVRGLLFANEWLDNVPLDVVEVGADGQARLVHVDSVTGTERLDAPATGGAVAWLERHWPLHGAEPGVRAEVGSTRDVAWARSVGRLSVGLAIAVDYHHRKEERPEGGTLCGFRAGRVVRPVPDGSCDLTAHVALDACAAAVTERAAAPIATALRSQRDVLRALGVGGDRPPRESADTDPTGYAHRLALATQAAALTAPDGLGGFGWLAHAKGLPLPAALTG